MHPPAVDEAPLALDDVALGNLFVLGLTLILRG
jgi:hypothetical protein